MRPLTAVLLLAAAPAASASQPVLNARVAQAIIAGCLADAQAKKNDQAIAIVDTGGRLIAALRFDGAPFGKMDFAEAKAVAAAAWGFDTAGQADGAKDFPGFARAPFVQTVPGGLAIWSGRLRLGAVGVSGAAPADDVACAQAGIKVAGLSSRPTP